MGEIHNVGRPITKAKRNTIIIDSSASDIKVKNVNKTDHNGKAKNTNVLISPFIFVFIVGVPFCE